MEEQLQQNTGKQLADQIAKEADVALYECYQCGKCSAGCPMADSMDLMPRQLVRYMQIGKMENVLKSKSIWLCASCHVCVERCPHSINIPGLMEQSRMKAKKLGYIGIKEVDRFNDIFMENVKIFGKSQEAVLEGVYNVTTGHLLQDMKHVPHMLKHKIIGPEVNTVKSINEVRDIINKSKKWGDTK